MCIAVLGEEDPMKYAAPFRPYRQSNGGSEETLLSSRQVTLYLSGLMLHAREVVVASYEFLDGRAHCGAGLAELHSDIQDHRIRRATIAYVLGGDRLVDELLVLPSGVRRSRNRWEAGSGRATG